MLATFALSLVLAAAPAAPAGDVFELFVGGKPLGEETVVREAGPDGPLVKGTVVLTVPQGRIEFRQVTRLAADGLTPRAYELEVALPGATQELRARRSAKGWTIEAGPAEAPTMQREHPVEGDWALVDNSMASHLDLLSRGAVLEPGATRPIAIVIPQAGAVVTGKLSRLPDAGGVRRLVLEMGGVRVEIDGSPSDGALVEARVPMQGAIYTRKGVVPNLPTAAAAVDPRERAMTLVTPEGDLPATFTAPKGEGPFPAVVVLAGSGPQDRDERIGPNAPMRDLGRALADRGVASFRFDKATTSAAIMAKRPITLRAEYDDDAARAVDALRATAGVDPSRVFVLGHSLGGAVTPRIAREAGAKVAGVVLLAAPARPADAIVVEQIRTQARLAGQDPDATVAPIAATLKTIREGGGGEAAFLGAPPSYWRETFAVDTAADLKGLGKPALVLQGENDVQIHPERDFGALRSKVGEDGGRVTYRLLAGLNHLLMKTDGPSTGAEYGAAGTLDPAVADAIASWIRGLPSPAKDAPKGNAAK